MDPIIGGAIVGAAGSVASSAANFFGQREQRSWQERMANTAYQRSAADMRAAGLNPSMMFGSGGPAQTPNVGPPQVENPLRGAPEAGVASARMAVETQRLANETRLSAAEVARKQAETENIRKGTPNVELQGQKLSQEVVNLAAELAAIRARTRHTTASARETEAGLPRKEAVGAAITELVKGKPPFEPSVQKILDTVLGSPEEHARIRSYKAREEGKNQRAWSAVKGWFTSGNAGSGSSAKDVGR